MGPSSAFGGAFGKMPGPAQGGPNPNSPSGMIPGSPLVFGGGGHPAGKMRTQQPITSVPQAASPANPTLPLGSVLGPQAIRASGPSQGFDPSYLQNLATAIGGLFSGGKNGVMNLNPLGNLSEISGTSGEEGNAPQQGIPMTWLQQALNGMGFSFTPQAPTVGTIGTRSGGGGGNNNGGGRGLRMAQ
jgi:hypothetical protein